MTELTDQCGPHCGVITTGKTKHVGHCECVELCHGRLSSATPNVKSILEARIDREGSRMAALMDHFGVESGPRGFVKKGGSDEDPPGTSV